jgi:hypothetical protein
VFDGDDRAHWIFGDYYRNPDPRRSRHQRRCHRNRDRIPQAHSRSDLLQIQHSVGATHSLVRKDIEDSTLETTVVAIAAPRSLFADGFLDNQRRSKTSDRCDFICVADS